MTCVINNTYTAATGLSQTTSCNEKTIHPPLSPYDGVPHLSALQAYDRPL